MNPNGPGFRHEDCTIGESNSPFRGPMVASTRDNGWTLLDRIEFTPFIRLHGDPAQNRFLALDWAHRTITNAQAAHYHEGVELPISGDDLAFMKWDRP